MRLLRTFFGQKPHLALIRSEVRNISSKCYLLAPMGWFVFSTAACGTYLLCSEKKRWNESLSCMIKEHSQPNLCDTAVPVKTQLLIYQIVSRLWFSVSASSKPKMMLFPLKLLVSFLISSDLLSIGDRYRAKSYLINDIWFNISKHSSQSWREKWSARRSQLTPRHAWR